jgi:hypothetical protein
LVDFPIEKIIIAGPGVDFGPANLAAETAGMLVWMLLPGRDVRQPAIGTAEKFGGPYVAGHPANMQKIRSGSSRHPALELTTSYSDFIKPADGLMASHLDGVRLAAQSGLKPDVAP